MVATDPPRFLHGSAATYVMHAQRIEQRVYIRARGAFVSLVTARGEPAP